MYIYLLLIKSKNIERGFTLIELLVVTIIVGILAALSMPNLLAQIGKARETEAATQLGALSRSQQAYHFEVHEFAASISSLDQNINLVNGYYNFPDPSIANDTIVKHQAIALAPWNNSSRNYAIGVYHNAGEFSTALCRAEAVASNVDAPNNSNDPCSNNGTKVK